MRLFNYLILEAVGFSWWISPKGEIKRIQGNGDTSHVEYMESHPEEFGYTHEQFMDVFKDFHEDFGRREGRAREFLIWKACERGWVRIRQYKNYWSINVSKSQFDDRVKENLKKWAVKTEGDEVSNSNDSVTVNVLGEYDKFWKDFNFKSINTTIKGVMNKTFAPDPWKQGAKPVKIDVGDKKEVKPEDDKPVQKEYKKPVKKVNPLRKRAVSYDFYESVKRNKTSS